MISICKQGLLFALLICVVVLPTTMGTEVKLLGNLVSDLTGNLVNAIVCLEDSSVGLLLDLLKDLSLGGLANLLESVLGPLLAGINGIVLQILGVVNKIASSLNI
ncbi:hypothetical protein ACLKA6_008616 [Drosophila palustris]